MSNFILGINPYCRRILYELFGLFITEKTPKEQVQSLCLNLLTSDWFAQDQIQYGHSADKAFSQDVQIIQKVCGIPVSCKTEIYPGELTKNLIGFYHREKGFENVFKAYHNGHLKFVAFVKNSDDSDEFFEFEELTKKAINSFNDLKELYEDPSVDNVRMASEEELD